MIRKIEAFIDGMILVVVLLTTLYAFGAELTDIYRSYQNECPKKAVCRTFR